LFAAVWASRLGGSLKEILTFMSGRSTFPAVASSGNPSAPTRAS